MMRYYDINLFRIEKVRTLKNIKKIKFKTLRYSVSSYFDRDVNDW